MYLIAIGWIYVVLMMSVAEAASPAGTLLGAVITFALYGVLPLAIVLYILGTPGRRRARQALEAHDVAPTAQASDQPDAGGHAPAGVGGPGAEPAPGAPVRKEP